MDPAATPTRIAAVGSFSLPCDAPPALMLFTPEGERAWVEGWAPTYLSGAVDEVGAVWTTDAHSHTVWVTVVRTDDHVAYARASDNGTAGIVDVRCLPAGGGASVHVTYDLTATSTSGLPSLQHVVAGFDGMLQEWRTLTLPLARSVHRRQFSHRVPTSGGFRNIELHKALCPPYCGSRRT